MCHCIAFNANLALYVVADTGVVGIIRCVLLLVPNPFKAAYMQIFNQMTVQHLSWVHGTPTENIPHLSQERLGYLQSMDVLKFHVHLWQALFRYVSTHGPIADVQAIVPTMVSVWNLVKNGGDLYSRLLNNAKPVHKKLPSRAKIALRGLYSNLPDGENLGHIEGPSQPKIHNHDVFKTEGHCYRNHAVVRNICREIASSMTMDMFNFIHTSDPTIPQALPATSQTTPVCEEGKNQQVYTYKKADCFVKSESLTSKRLDKSTIHPCVPIQGDRMRCILCCSRCTYGDGILRERTSVHARLGHLQRFECATCKATLCKKARFVWMGRQESCFSLFHTVSKEDLAMLCQNLCACANPAQTAVGSMVVVDPKLQERCSE